MENERKPGRRGRPSKGKRRLLSTRLNIRLAEIIVEEAATCGMSISDYLAAHLALTHSHPWQGEMASSATPAAETSPDSTLAASSLGPTAPDPELRILVARVDEAASESGLTPMEFSAALGVTAVRMAAYRSGSRDLPAAVYLRALRVSEGLRRARESGWMSPATAGLAFRLALADADDHWALRICVQTRDHLRAAFAEAPAAVPAWEAAPGTSGRAHWDVLLAAMIEHEFSERERTAPAWTRRPVLRLDPGWIFENPLMDAAEIRAETPRWLSAWGVFVAERDLGGRTDPRHGG